MTATVPTWTRPAGLTLRRIPISKIDIPPEYERQDLVTDDAVGKSIARNGVNVPVHVYQKGDRFVLIKGGRRVRIAGRNGHHDVPAMIEAIPEGWSEESFRNRLRFILTTLRQDLRPSERASLERQTMQQFGLNQKELAALLGWDAGSITNHLAIEKYSPEWVSLIDSGQTDLFHARALDGMTEKGQKLVLREFKRELATLSGGAFHKLVRSKFNPKSHPDLYVAPEKTAEKLQRKQKGRKSSRRPRLTRDEKEALSGSVEVAEIELEDLQKDNTRMKRECMLAGPIVAAILRNPRLKGMLSEEMRFELETFSERF